MSSIHLSDISKAYGTQVALSNISLEIRDGELMVLVGPSGCGKSTLLRSIAGLEDVTAGDILIDEQRVNDLAPHRRNVAMVFQSYALYPNLTVFENIAFPLRATRTPRHEVNQRVDEVAYSLGLTDYLKRRPRELSGGQRQRVAIARAIIRSPQAFLMDEPLSNLDAKLRVRMRAEIMRLQRTLQTTTVFVTHDQVEAMTMGDRITVLNGGQIQQVGTPYEIYHRPANTFVASFVGAPPMNLATCTLRYGSQFGRTHIEWHPGQLVVPRELGLELQDGLPDGRDLVVGIRPEDLRLCDESEAMIQGVVDLVEYLGSETLVTVLQGEQEWVVKLAGKQVIAVNQPIALTAAFENIYLFDAVSQQLAGTLAQFQRIPETVGGLK
ncbi:ABC transporter ATP-binding protein [Alicyclobacillus tolerans]|uniref:ABC transporter ATP-binding protein n=1 Tax=Alicyclobacillus tolerans TaxID=90970 RepID=UPI001F280187|nr:ABC transporter ATP-binding protein [Alicyclobacillus tolerans]MCF8566428.1 ABC transporter ATP-binding protein [Alicyclobacillus tolerans]